MTRKTTGQAVHLAGFFCMTCYGAAIAEPLVIPGFGPQDAQAVHDRALAQRPAIAPTPSRQPMAVAQAAPSGAYGGGLFEMLASGGRPRPIAYAPQPQQAPYGGPYNAPLQQASLQQASLGQPSVDGTIGRQVDPIYQRQEVGYDGPERPGTIVVDTPNKFLFLVQPGGRALRYGIGVGRPGFAWAGVKTITRKAEWPGWTPPPEMIKRRPDLPSHMDGGPANPLGARAMYLGSSLYRIHGTNEPYTIGTNVSSGCIRLMNEDVVDLYARVGVGTKVIVI